MKAVKGDTGALPGAAPWFLGACLSLALGLRLWGVEHGFPDFVTGDERAVIKDAVRFVQKATLEPLHLNYPAFYAYLFAAGLWGAYAVSGLPDAGAVGDSVLLAHYFFPTQIALVGRLVSVFLGVGTVAATYALGRRAYGPGVAVGGSLFAAVSAVMVEQARLALPDVATGFFAVWACCRLVAVAQGREGRRAYLLGGALIGLAAACKYNGALLLPALLAAHVQRPAGQRNWLDLAAGGAAAAACFLAATPYWLVKPVAYWEALRAVGSNLGFSLAPVDWPWGRLAADLGRTEAAWAVLGVLGIGYALKRRAAPDGPLLVAVLVGLVYIGAWPKGGLHYALYLLPVLGILGARAVLQWATRPAWGLALLLAASVPQLAGAWQQGQQLRQADLRSVVARWVERHVPDGSVVGVYRIDYSPPLKGDIQRAFLARLLAGDGLAPQDRAALDRLYRSTPIYTQLSLEYFADRPQVPPEYRGQVDLQDPKTRETFRRTWMSYEEMKHWQVAYLILPSDGYARFFERPAPPAGTAAHYYYTRSKAYLSQLLAPQGRRFRPRMEFTSADGARRIRIVEVL